MLRCGKFGLCCIFLSNALRLLTSLTCYSSTILLLILMDKGIGVSRAFPLTRQLLNELDNNGAEQQQLRQLIDVNSSPDENERTDGNLRSQFHHFRIRHENRRMNRVKEALIYLRKFGYLNKGELSEDNVEAALKSCQQVLGVRTSGELDRKTINGMRMPRCGNSDVESPTHFRRLRRRFAQMSRWLNKMDDQDVLHLQWYIEKYTKDIPRENIRDVIKRAFKLWSDQVTIQSMRTLKLDFVEASGVSQSDISIMWAEGDHGDAYPFDGPGNTTNILAHTFYPNYQETGSLNGDIHFDDYETWVLDNANQDGGVRFPYVLVHEIGHALGLGHSRRQEAVMNPIYKQTPLNEITLDIDDKCAVNWNYIGPTRTCLFIWLLIEYLPRAQETNTSHGFGTPTNASSAGPGSFYSHAVGEQALDDRVTRTLNRLQLVHIPQCSSENDLQQEYEALLMNKLEFPPESAQRYAPVVCNFLDGLRETLSNRRRTSASTTNESGSDTSASTTGNTWTLHSAEQRELIDAIAPDSSRPAAMRVSNQPLVHSYSSSPFASEQYSAFHALENSDSTLDSSSSDSSHQAEEIFSLRRESSGGNAVDIYSRRYFDDAFFDRLLRLVVSSRLMHAGQPSLVRTS